MNKQTQGIYKIGFSGVKKVYIGCSTDIFKRWQGHVTALMNQKHPVADMQNDFNKYGLFSMCFEILEVCDKENLRNLERFYLINQGDNVYNVRDRTPYKITCVKRSFIECNDYYPNLKRLQSERYCPQVYIAERLKMTSSKFHYKRKHGGFTKRQIKVILEHLNRVSTLPPIKFEDL